jgi:uncharacterized membrane protein
MKPIQIITITLLILTILTTILIYNYLPEQLTTHWNQKGEPDGQMPKLQGAFLTPLLLTMALLLLYLVPKIDPLKNNLKKFRKHYDIFILFLTIFLILIHAITLAWNLNYKVSINIIVPILVAFFIYYAGILIKKSKRNWFVGIRTPWTLTSDKVWDKTSQLGGKLFKILAVIILLSIFFQNYIVYFILIPTLLIVIYLWIYSYLEFKKLK